MSTSVQFGNYQPIERPEPTDFDIILSLGQQKTVVPMGILDFENNYENPFFSFNYSLTGVPLESLDFKILDEDGNMLYGMTYLEPIIVRASRKQVLEAQAQKEVPPFNFEKPVRSWDYLSLFKPEKLSPPDYTIPGSYVLHWDGFDNNEIFDSRKFNNKKLKAVITGEKAGVKKKREIEFTVKFSEVNWTDIKIDRNAKRVDVEIRVNLTDGGVQGFEIVSYRNPLDDPRMPSQRRPKWQNVPPDLVARRGQPPLQAATRTYDQLKQLAISGLNYHWGRNSNHYVAKSVSIGGVAYQVFINAVNITDAAKSIDDVELTYNTNGDSMRSGNPGTVEDPLSAIGNVVSREAICYNVGYIEFSDGWGYVTHNHADNEFKDTSAHEIGHSILKAYGGTIYSYGHKGSVNWAFQTQKSSAPQFPMYGEIDIMPYFKNNALGNEHKQPNYFARRVAAEKDVLSLIWLTKLSIQ
jgi:hypothetical protein